MLKNRELLIAIALFFMGILQAWTYSDRLIDDAYISLKYAENITFGGGWGIYPGLVLNSATSPLHILFLIPFVALLHSKTAIFFLSTSACIFLIVFCLYHLQRALRPKQSSFLIIALIGILFNPLIISTQGLESLLSIALLCALCFAVESCTFNMTGMLVGLLTLSRLEYILLLPLVLYYLPSKCHRKKCFAHFSAIMLPWMGFSWMYLGSFLPDSLFIKCMLDSWGTFNFSNGPLLYADHYTSQTLLSFAFLPVAIIAFFSRELRKHAWTSILLIFSMLHWISYSFLVVPPYHWYYISEIFTLIMFAALLSSIESRYRISLLFSSLVCISYVINTLMLTESPEMPIHSNWASTNQYKAMAKDLDSLSIKGNICVTGEVGIIASCSSVHLSDKFTDRFWMNNIVKGRQNRSGIMGAFWRINFLFYKSSKNSFCNYYLARISAKYPKLPTEVTRWEVSTRWSGPSTILLRRSDN